MQAESTSPLSPSVTSMSGFTLASTSTTPVIARPSALPRSAPLSPLCFRSTVCVFGNHFSTSETVFPNSFERCISVTISSSLRSGSFSIACIISIIAPKPPRFPVRTAMVRFFPFPFLLTFLFNQTSPSSVPYTP